MRAAAVLVLLLIPQDPVDKVRALVEKLGSDEIAAREQAAAELVKLGPGTLPQLRKHLEASDGDRKALLTMVIRKLERDERIAGVFDPPNLVTLKMKDAPYTEVFAELGRQTGMPMHGYSLHKDLRLSVDLAKATPWEALDSLCRIHGHLSWGLQSAENLGGLIVANGDWTERFRFKAEGFTVEPTAFRCGHLELRWDIFHGPAPTFRLVRFEVEEVRDDRGKNLGVELTAENLRGLNPPGYFTANTPRVNVRGSTVFWRSQEEVSPKAERLSRLKGRLILETTFDVDPPERRELVLPMDLKDVPLR
jgi:hypothetical protein